MVIADDIHRRHSHNNCQGEGFSTSASSGSQLLVDFGEANREKREKEKEREKEEEEEGTSRGQTRRNSLGSMLLSRLGVGLEEEAEMTRRNSLHGEQGSASACAASSNSCRRDSGGGDSGGGVLVGLLSKMDSSLHLSSEVLNVSATDLLGQPSGGGHWRSSSAVAKSDAASTAVPSRTWHPATKKPSKERFSPQHRHQAFQGSGQGGDERFEDVDGMILLKEEKETAEQRMSFGGRRPSLGSWASGMVGVG